MSKLTRIALLQHACTSDVLQNIETALSMIREAASQGAQVIFTQELFTSEYFCQVEDPIHFNLAITIPSSLTDQLCDLAKELEIHLVASIFEKRAAGLFHNTSICINAAGTLVNRYRKMHIPDDPGFYEKFYFTPGDPPGSSAPASPKSPGDLNRSLGSSSKSSETSGDGGSGGGYQVTQLGDLNVGTLICWDQWFPEAARLTAMLGAQILTYPTAIGYWNGDPPESAEEGARQRDAWITIQRSHAIANGCYVAAINRIGREGDITFWGSSFIADPSGNIIIQASEDQQQILIADIDLSRLDSTRQMWPFFRDRRVDSYENLSKRWDD